MSGNEDSFRALIMALQETGLNIPDPVLLDTGVLTTQTTCISFQLMYDKFLGPQVHMTIRTGDVWITTSWCMNNDDIKHEKNHSS